MQLQLALSAAGAEQTALSQGSGPAGLQQRQVIVLRHLDDLRYLRRRRRALRIGDVRCADQELCQQRPRQRACSRSSRLSGGCRRLLCGSTTVSRCGFSARSAPLMTAALVPVAPEV